MKCPKCNEEITHAEIQDANADHYSTPARETYRVATERLETRLLGHAKKALEEKGMTSYQTEQQKDNIKYGFYWTHTDETNTEFEITKDPPIPE